MFRLETDRALIESFRVVQHVLGPLGSHEVCLLPEIEVRIGRPLWVLEAAVAGLGLGDGRDFLAEHAAHSVVPQLGVGAEPIEDRPRPRLDRACVGVDAPVQVDPDKVGALVAGLVSRFAIDRVLGPLARMEARTAEIGAEDLSRRLDVVGDDEFARMGRTVNAMLARLEEAFARERRFTADASHEMKTPIAVVKAHAGVILHLRSAGDEVRRSAESIDAAAGRLTTIHTLSTLPSGMSSGQNSTAEVVVHPSGKFLYGSNRGDDSIVVYTLDQDTGRMTLAGHDDSGGQTPRHFSIDDTGSVLFVANRDTDNVVVFDVNPTTGRLTEVSEATNVQQPEYAALVTLPGP